MPSAHRNAADRFTDAQTGSNESRPPVPSPVTCSACRAVCSAHSRLTGTHEREPVEPTAHRLTGTPPTGSRTQTGATMRRKSANLSACPSKSRLSCRAVAAALSRRLSPRTRAQERAHAAEVSAMPSAHRNAADRLTDANRRDLD